MTEAQQEEVKKLMEASDWLDPISMENATQVSEAVLYHQVIERRKSYLDSIKASLRSTGLLNFIVGQPFLRHGISPRGRDIQYPPDIVLSRINCDDERVLTILKTSKIRTVLKIRQRCA